jgi:hypothetical protein
MIFSPDQEDIHNYLQRDFEKVMGVLCRLSPTLFCFESIFNADFFSNSIQYIFSHDPIMPECS